MLPGTELTDVAGGERTLEATVSSLMLWSVSCALSSIHDSLPRTSHMAGPLL